MSDTNASPQYIGLRILLLYYCFTVACVTIARSVWVHIEYVTLYKVAFDAVWMLIAAYTSVNYYCSLELTRYVDSTTIEWYWRPAPNRFLSTDKFKCVHWYLANYFTLASYLFSDLELGSVSYRSWISTFVSWYVRMNCHNDKCSFKLLFGSYVATRILWRHLIAYCCGSDQGFQILNSWSLLRCNQILMYAGFSALLLSLTSCWSYSVSVEQSLYLNLVFWLCKFSDQIETTVVFTDTDFILAAVIIMCVCIRLFSQSVCDFLLRWAWINIVYSKTFWQSDWRSRYLISSLLGCLSPSLKQAYTSIENVNSSRPEFVGVQAALHWAERA